MLIFFLIELNQCESMLQWHRYFITFVNIVFFYDDLAVKKFFKLKIITVQRELLLSGRKNAAHDLQLRTVEHKS